MLYLEVSSHLKVILYAILSCMNIIVTLVLLYHSKTATVYQLYLNKRMNSSMAKQPHHHVSGEEAVIYRQSVTQSVSKA